MSWISVQNVKRKYAELRLYLTEYVKEPVAEQTACKRSMQ